jgi:putative peptidoglycan lipid II flippase
LNYGSRIVSGVLGVVANPLGTAVLPSFSRLVALGDWTGVRRLFRNYTLVAFAAGLLPMLLIILASHPLTVLFYQRGAFSAADADHVANIQIAFALQIPTYLMSTVTVRLLAALRRNWIRTIGGCANLFFDILFNYWFMQRLGIIGIALATSLVGIVSFLFLSLVLRRELRVASLEHNELAGSFV